MDKHRILKVLAVVRAVCLALFVLFLLLAAVALVNLANPFVYLLIAAICGVVAYYIDQIIWLNN